MGLEANAERFTGYADAYDAVRPTPPVVLGPLLASYAGGAGLVVDLGCGTGLSSRWAQTWAERVVGIEPSADMRTVAAERSPGLDVRRGWAHDTGLDGGVADVVLAVQALHWMEPAATFAEVARILRPGGVFAAVDCDWPPAVGVVEAEQAWERCRAALRVVERRLAEGAVGDELDAPVPGDDPEAQAHSGADAHRDRVLAGGVRSWSKSGHLDRMRESGHFDWCRELVVHAAEEGDADRFVDLLRSQGDYRTLRRHGLDDDTLGVTALASTARRTLGPDPRPWLFTYRVRVARTLPAT